MDLTFPWEAPAFAPIFAQRAIELQAVPSIQSLQPPSHEGILGPSAAELLDEAFPRTTAKRKLDLPEGLPSFQLIRKPAVASLRQSTLRHALVSRLLILLKAAGDSCPILALADEDPWMGWQLVSDVVSGRSEAAPPLRQKPAILVSQVKRLELLTDSDEPALVNIVPSTPGLAGWICSGPPASSFQICRLPLICSCSREAFSTQHGFAASGYRPALGQKAPCCLCTRQRLLQISFGLHALRTLCSTCVL